MRKYLLLLLGCFMCVGAAMAQHKHECRKPNPKMWKEIQDFKLKFLAQEMELNKDQQTRFFELYTEMSEKKREIFDEIRNTERKLENEKDASDKDYEEASRKLTEAKEKDAALEREYDAKFATFLSTRQIYKMKSGEEKFRRKMSKMRYHGKHSKTAGKPGKPDKPLTK